MASPVEIGVEAELRARLTEQIRERLETAHGLALASRKALSAGDAAATELLVARLESTAEEFKLLTAELAQGRAVHAEAGSRLERAQADLAATVTRLARAAAINGGLLERMIAVARGRLGLLNAARSGTYERNGESSPYAPQGVRLRESV